MDGSHQRSSFIGALRENGIGARGHLIEAKRFDLKRRESVLAALTRWKTGGWFLNGGTQTAACLRASYREHDRVVIITDEQAAHDPKGVTASVPARVPVYTWNLAGYAVGHAPSGAANRHVLGGLNDQAFAMIPLLEAGRNAAWPFSTV